MAFQGEWIHHDMVVDNNLRYADGITLMAGSEELKSLLMMVKEESKKNWLKTQHSKTEDYRIWSHHFMTNRWEKSGNTTDFIFLSSKITVTAAMKLKDACSLEEKL